MQYKLSVLRYAQQYSVLRASREFHIHHSMIYRWRQSEHFMSLKPKTSKRLGTPGRKIKFPVQEQVLYQWVLDCIEKKLLLNWKSVIVKMNEITQSNCSYGWLYGFIKRFQLALRTVTHSIDASKNCTKIKSDLMQKQKSFSDYISQSIHSFDKVINMDETPVWLNCASTNKIVALKGTKDIFCIRPPGSNHEKATVILAVHKDGTKLPPAVIVKSNSKKPRIKLVNGVLVFYNPKTSMSNHRITKQWIQVMLQPIATEKTMLIMDSFKDHLTADVADKCSEFNIARAIIPGGLTGKLQPLDLTVNRSFKCKLKDYLRQNTEYEKPQNMTMHQYSIHILTKAVKNAWARVSKLTIMKGFRPITNANN
jgi:hypothetical protein